MKLKPCPCCGAKARFGEQEDSGGRFVECENGGCGMTTMLMLPLKEPVDNILAEIWNTRPASVEATMPAIDVFEMVAELQGMGHLDSDGADVASYIIRRRNNKPEPPSEDAVKALAESMAVKEVEATKDVSHSALIDAREFFKEGYADEALPANVWDTVYALLRAEIERRGGQ